MYSSKDVETKRKRLREEILKAIETYNRYRSPEAYAKLIASKNEEVIVKFEGIFCQTCGVRDWIEDLVYIFMDYGLNAELIAYIEPVNNRDNYRIGIFKIKNSNNIFGGGNG